MGLKLTGWGGMGKFLWDGVGMGLMSTTMWLFSANSKSTVCFSRVLPVTYIHYSFTPSKKTPNLATEWMTFECIKFQWRRRDARLPFSALNRKTNTGFTSARFRLGEALSCSLQSLGNLVSPGLTKVQTKTRLGSPQK